MELLFMIIFILVFAFISISTIYRKNKRNKKINIRKLKNKLLIIQLMNNNRKYNFLIDTGSTASHISDRYMTDFGNVGYKCKSDIYGMGGEKNINTFIMPEFIYKGKYCNHKISVPLLINKGMNSMMDMMKEDYNIEIHGVVGMDFIDKYISEFSFNNNTILLKR